MQRQALSGEMRPSCTFNFTPALGTDHVPKPVLGLEVGIPEKTVPQGTHHLSGETNLSPGNNHMFSG